VTLREQLIRDEGLRLMPYRDSEGFLTIGIGRCLDRVGISSDEAEYLLDNDIRDVFEDLSRHLPWANELSEARRGVLANMCFNLGIHGLLGFRIFLAAAERGDIAEATAAMLDSKWARQVGLRAVRLAKQYETDEWH
jgi:lysozyme